MDNDKKLFEELLKTDGINPKAPTETERETFREMLDSEKKRVKHLNWYVYAMLGTFLLVIAGVIVQKNILKALHIPLYFAIFVVWAVMLILMMRYMPRFSYMIAKSNKKIRKLHYLAHGKHKGYAMVGRKNGKRVIHWLRFIMAAAGLWLIVSLISAVVYYLLHDQWEGMSFFNDIIISLMFAGTLLVPGLTAPLDELTEVKTKSKPPKPGLRHGAWGMIMQSRISKFAAAAIVISILIPISVGASRAIKRLIVKSVSIAEFTGDFKADEDMNFDLRIGTKEDPMIVFGRNIRLFEEDGQLRGTLRSGVSSWPKFKWRVSIDMVDATGKSTASTEQVRENSGNKHQGFPQGFEHNMHFSLGPWDEVSQGQAKTICVKYEQVSEDVATTPDAWKESSILDIVHGRVTEVGGKPVANAEVQIREKRVQGQKYIAAMDVTTDRDGYYHYDDLKWAYTIGVIVYDEDPSGLECYHRYKRCNKTFNGTEKVDFKFEKFPQGGAVLSGQAFKLDGTGATEFEIGIRNKVDWKDYSGKYLHQYGFKKNFVSTDGKFEIPSLPPGAYRIAIRLTGKEFEGVDFDLKYFQQECELADGKTTEITNETEAKKVGKAIKTALDESVSYYGRILYANGKPAVPPVLPWELAEVYVKLRYTKATSSHGGRTERLGDVDKQGYFKVNLSDEQLANIKNGKYKIEINHPSYEWENHIYGIGTFPVEMLTLDRNTSKGYKLVADGMSGEFKNLERELKSYYVLDELGSALQKFSGKHRGRLPASLNMLPSFADTETLTWIMENVQYQPVKKKSTGTAVFPVAYDKTLLEKIKSTHVLFSDGTIKFLRQRELEVIESH